MESLCLEGGGALRLKLNENFNKNCTDAGILEHGIGWAALRAKDCCPSG